MPYKELLDAFAQLAKDHGVISAGIVFAVGSHYWMIYWLVKKLHESKNDEIERLVDIRNKLLNKALNTRLSTKRKKGK